MHFLKSTSITVNCLIFIARIKETLSPSAVHPVCLSVVRQWMIVCQRVSVFYRNLRTLCNWAIVTPPVLCVSVCVPWAHCTSSAWVLISAGLSCPPPADSSPFPPLRLMTQPPHSLIHRYLHQLLYLSEPSHPYLPLPPLAANLIPGLIEGLKETVVKWSGQVPSNTSLHHDQHIYIYIYIYIFTHPAAVMSLSEPLFYFSLFFSSSSLGSGCNLEPEAVYKLSERSPEEEMEAQWL